MTVLPGSLDYLYYNGILDYIPYEAYEYPVYNNGAQSRNQFINASQYLQGVQSSYNYQPTLNDAFVSNGGVTQTTSGGYVQNNGANGFVNSYGDSFVNTGVNSASDNVSSYRNGQVGMQNNTIGGQSFRQELLNAGEKTKESLLNTSSVVKGLLALGAVFGTVYYIFRRK